MRLDKIALQLTFETFRKSAFCESYDASESSKLWESRSSRSFRSIKNVKSRS